MSYRKGKRGRDEDDEPEQSDDIDVDVDALFKCELSAKRRLKVHKYKDLLLCDIREMFFNAEGKLLPTKKGISLTRDQVAKLLEHGQEILAAFESASTSSSNPALPSSTATSSHVGPRVTPLESDTTAGVKG